MRIGSKGGIAITYRDEKKEFGEIGVFTPFEELNSILSKVKSAKDFLGLSSIVVSRTAYRLTDILHKEHPEAISQLSKGHAYDMSTNIFDRLPQVFFSHKPNDNYNYIQILGRENNERIYKFIRRDFVNQVVNLDLYKILLPKANGSGSFGEQMAPAVIAPPAVGNTETFISIGKADSEEHAVAIGKYIRCKFARTLLGVLKTTQDLTPEKFKYVPIQDFTETSDINWSLSISDIDRQLYKKYGLTEEEIRFIETHVREMA